MKHFLIIDQKLIELKCVVLKYIHILSKEAYWKFHAEGSLKTNIFKGKHDFTKSHEGWDFQEDGSKCVDPINNYSHSKEGYWKFHGEVEEESQSQCF